MVACTISSTPLLLLSLFFPSSDLLLGHCEWFLHLNFATVVDRNIFKRFITTIGLCALNLLHHILKKRVKESKINLILLVYMTQF